MLQEGQEEDGIEDQKKSMYENTIIKPIILQTKEKLYANFLKDGKKNNLKQGLHL